MDFASICVPANKLGNGCYSTAYKVPNDPSVVVLLNNSDADDCRYSFMQWCAERLRKFGLMSPEMSMLPEVYFVGKYLGTHVAVMRKYRRTNCDKYGNAFNARANAVARRFSALYSTFFACSDCHGGNQWWCQSRKTWIVSDPMADCNSPGEFNVSTETRPAGYNSRSLKRNSAQWLGRRIGRN